MRGIQKEMLLNSVSLNFSFMGITTARLKSLNILSYFLVIAPLCLTGGPPQLIMKRQTLICFLKQWALSCWLLHMIVWST